eukprot:Nk52_evm57s252 gene=Nk52_evmTU57s252
MAFRIRKWPVHALMGPSKGIPPAHTNSLKCTMSVSILPYRSYAAGVAGAQSVRDPSPALSELNDTYNPKEIEAHWQKHWSEKKSIFSPGVELKENNKRYILTMFPYPSGYLHMGHARVYTLSDATARFCRLQGFDTVHPMGWDSFGLPAENAAIERGISPKSWTVDNIAVMKEQFGKMGMDFDWDLELLTSSREYYRWTQWLFLQMFKKNIAYQNEAMVNWDPVDKTVLANEQVGADGTSWRSGAKVEVKYLKQWFLKITEYAEELIDGLSDLQWPASVKKLQKEWIKKSEGCSLIFRVDGAESNESLEVFTTQPHTVFGVTYVAVGKDHPLVRHIEGGPESSTGTKSRDFSEWNGFNSGVNVIHPFTKEKIPVYVADYVITDYGSGAVMGVPAHDERDFAFATAHEIPIVSILNDQSNVQSSIPVLKKSSKDLKLRNSGPFSGMTVPQGGEAIVESAENEGFGKKTVNYRLRDWLISRQRYWGAPIPIIHCEHCQEAVPVPEEDLPVVLPEVQSSSDLSLASVDEFVNVPCPNCSKPAKRDTDTMDTFVDSSWYFLRFLDPHNKKEIFKKSRVSPVFPVDTYIGGVEHAVLHLLYARFVTKFLQSEGLIDCSEPFKHYLAQGLVMGQTYRTTESGRYLKPHEVEQCSTDENGALHHNGEAVSLSWEKMSKSKYNGVDPMSMVEEYGSDAVRMCVLFKAPPELPLEWNLNGIRSSHMWLRKFWTFVSEFAERKRDNFELFHKGEGVSKWNQSIVTNTNKAIETYTSSVNVDKNIKLNRAVAVVMEMFNDLRDIPKDASSCAKFDYSMKTMLKLLAPICPHIASELWMSVNKPEWEAGISIPKDIFDAGYPSLMEKDLSAPITVDVMVNGKKRAKLEMSEETLMKDPNEVKEYVFSQVDVEKQLKISPSAPVVKVIVNRYVNIIVRNPKK